jgi:hypothetical protein
VAFWPYALIECEICWDIFDSVTSCVTGVGHVSLKGGIGWSVHFKANKNQMLRSDISQICTMQNVTLSRELKFR